MSHYYLKTQSTKTSNENAITFFHKHLVHIDRLV